MLKKKEKNKRRRTTINEVSEATRLRLSRYRYCDVAVTVDNRVESK